MQGLTGAHQQLKVSADKLNISKKALEEVEKAPEGACWGGPPTVGACSCCARLTLQLLCTPTAPLRRNQMRVRRRARPGPSPPPLGLGAGTRMLVPITSSLYVPGETAPLDTVLIDVGTGYYIEKSGPEAQAFLDRKIHLITGQAYKVAQAMQIKQEGLQGTVRAMNSKITEYQQQQKQQAAS